MFCHSQTIMEKILCFIPLLAVVNCFKLGFSDELESKVFGDEDDTLKSGIVGGEFTEINTVPYLAQILKDGDHFCGSAILSKYWIVTAAHCLEDEGELSLDTEKWTVITGSSVRSKGGHLHTVKKIIAHENYDNLTSDNDIALFELEEPIKFDELQQAIEISNRVPKADDKLKISGWGKQGERRGVSKQLKTAVVPVIDQTECLQMFEKYLDYEDYRELEVTNNMLCAGANGEDTCQGDSGGPAVIAGKLAGVTSWGFDCGSKKTPGAYTRIRNYRQWIAEHTKRIRKRNSKKI
ncbi:serine protease 33 isoform X2 [Nasonia vitripennis]|uniref:trypsin n=1 Tax=Nasonia vitripennis TaxID=7425 RepID=A0A7M7TBH9_NASVI|nr:serine protease 33 isoform X2 [Nasonia vitripennis]